MEIVLAVDPDVLYSYEIQKAGLGYIAERAGWLGTGHVRGAEPGAEGRAQESSGGSGGRR